MGKWFAWIWLSIGLLGWAWAINKWTGYFLMKANYEHVRGTITGYIKDYYTPIQGESGGGVAYLPIIDFVYRGDSLRVKGGVGSNADSDLNEEVDLYFPPGKPEEADISTYFWALPVIISVVSFLFFILPIWIIGQQRRSDLRHDMQLYLLGPADYRPILRPSQAFIVATIVSFGYGLLLIWGATRLTTIRVVDWSVVSLMYGIAAGLFMLGYLGWRRISRKDIFKKHFDAKFEKVTRSFSKDGGWVMECSWSDPEVIGRFTYVSLPFDGELKYYNRDKILVNLAWRGSQIYYQVDLSFLSKDNPTGIQVVDQAAIDNILKEEIEADERYYKRHGRRSSSDKARRKMSLNQSATLVTGRIQWQGWILIAVVVAVVSGIALLFVRYNQLISVNDAYSVYVTQNIDTDWGYDFEFDTEIQSLIESPVYPTGLFSVNGITHNRSWKMYHYLTSTEENPHIRFNTEDDVSWHLPFQMTLKIDDDSLSGRSFLMVADFPDNFPPELVQMIKKNNGAIKELSNEGYRNLAVGYTYHLFDQVDDPTSSESPVAWGVHENGSQFSVVATNHPNGLKLLTPKFWEEYTRLKAGSKISAGLLITQWHVVVGAMNARIAPSQFESFTGFGMSMADFMKKLK